jgi:hypothetical protein
MKIYDIISESKQLNEVNPGRGPSMAEKMWNFIKDMITKDKANPRPRTDPDFRPAWFDRIEPFIEKSSDEYAEAVLKARSEGKLADPNPYAVLRDKLDPSLSADDMKVLLDEIAKRGIAKAETKAGAGRGTTPDPRRTDSKPTSDETPASTTKTDAARAFDNMMKAKKEANGSWYDYIRRKFPNSVPSRLLIHDLEVIESYEKYLGNAVIGLKAWGVFQVGKDWWLDKLYFDKLLAQKDITPQQHTILIRERTETQIVKLMSLGLGATLARAIGSNMSWAFGLLSFGLMEKRTRYVISVLGFETVAAYWLQKMQVQPWWDRFAVGIAQHWIDPAVVEVSNFFADMTGWEEIATKTMDEAIEEIKKTQKTNQPAPTAPAGSTPGQSGEVDTSKPLPQGTSYDDVVQGIGKK